MSGRRFSAAFLVVAAICYGVSSSAAAQDWGITRPTDRPNRPPPGKRPPSNRPHRPSRPAPPDSQANTTPGNPGDRSEVLIARYLGILDQDPRESFAFQRLLDLYRQRDGNIDALVGALEARASADPRDFAARMLLGHIYKAQSRLDDARLRYGEARVLRPDDPAPLIATATIDRTSGRVSEARQGFESALALLREPNERRELLRILGELSMESGDYPAAENYYRQVAAGNDGGVFVLMEYARALTARNEYERAIAEYQRVVASLHGDNRVVPPVLLELARAQLGAGDANGSIETLNRALRLSGRESGARAELYDVMLEAYRLGDRLRELAEQLARERGRGFESQELLGRIHEELGDEAEALTAYRAALGSNPNHVDTRVRVIQILSRSGRMDDVIAEYRRLLRQVPGEPRFVVELAQLLMQTGHREEALAMAQQASQRNGRDPGVHQALAQLYTEWGEEELARAEVQILARIEPNDPSHLIALGAQQYDAGNTDQAIATWRRILTAGGRAEAHATLAAVFADHNLLEEAEAEYREAVRRDANDLVALRGLANILERRAASAPRLAPLLDEAIRQWMEVLARSNLDRAAAREARQRIVGIYQRRGQFEERLQAWTRDFNADPPDLEAGRFLATAYLRARPPRPDDAEIVLARLIEFAPGDVETLTALERVRVARGDLSGAIEILRLLADADARRAPSYLSRMAEHALALYRDEDAVRYAEMAVERTPDDANAHRQLGDLYRARQQNDEAVRSYRRAIELNDRLFSTYFDLAEVYLARGDSREADQLFRVVLRTCPDDDLVVQAARASMQIHLGSGTLEALEADLLPLAIGNPRRPIFRRLAVEFYDAHSAPLIAQVEQGGAAASDARAELLRLGTRAIQPILQALADSDPTQQRVAIRILRYLGNDNAAGPLLAAAESEGAMDFRVQALVAAAAIASAEYRERFVALAEGSERRLHGPAAWAVARLASDRDLPVLMSLLDSGDPTVRGFAAIGLGRIRNRTAREELELRVRDERHMQVRAAAAWALGQIADPESVSTLTAALREHNGVLARAAADALGRIADPGSQAVLAEAVFDPDSDQQGVASRALLRIASGESDREPGEFPPLLPRMEAGAYVELLLDSSMRDREVSGVEIEPHLESLARAATDGLRGPLERRLGVLALLVSREEGVGLGALTAGLDGWPEPARIRAARALDELGLRLVEPLVDAASHPDARVRELSIQVLARIEDDRARAALLDALSDEDTTVQRATLEALAAVPLGEDAVSRVAELLLANREWSIRMNAAELLGRFGSEDAVDPLCTALRDDPYAYVRAAAATALGAIDSLRGRQALESASEQDAEPSVREAARGALR